MGKMIKKIVRIGTVQEQDRVRREDMRRMSPVERVGALIELRDRAFPYEPLKRVATVRKLDWCKGIEKD
jgi:hypothetical protein